MADKIFLIPELMCVIMMNFKHRPDSINRMADTVEAMTEREAETKNELITNGSP